jgi:hypothetical protein
MTEHPRAPKTVQLTASKPRVPEPHAADYSTAIPDANLKLIDELCNQAELASGKTLQRFEW